MINNNGFLGDDNSPESKKNRALAWLEKNGDEINRRVSLLAWKMLSGQEDKYRGHILNHPYLVGFVAELEELGLSLMIETLRVWVAIEPDSEEGPEFFLAGAEDNPPPEEIQWSSQDEKFLRALKIKV